MNDESSCSLFVEIPNDLVKRIVGRAGLQLRAFEKTQRCSITVRSEKDVDKSTIEITAASEYQCDSTRAAIEKFLENIQPNSTKQGFICRLVDRQSNQSTMSSDRSAERREDDTMTADASQTVRGKVTIEVAKPHVGRLIGKGGAKINEFRSLTGCSLTLVDFEDKSILSIDHDDTERCLSAKKVIEDYIKEKTFFASTDSQQTTYKEKLDEYHRRVNDDDYWQKQMEEARQEEEETWAAFDPIVRGFYTEHAEITEMTDDQVRLFRNDNMGISVQNFEKNSNIKILKPVVKFEHAFAAYPEILTQLKEKFDKPSPIQCQTWPQLLQGNDVIGIAQTGTGKTLAFLLPALIHIDNQTTPRENRYGPTCLILTPTRELALQIHDEVKSYSYKKIRSACLYGGGDRRAQMRQVEAGVEIIIATPGRLNDLVDFGTVKLHFVTYLVLDEADRMLDMGFEPQIRTIVQYVRPNRQTVMTSATMPPIIQKLARRYMNDPIQVNVGSLDLSAAHSVTQRVELVSKEEKFDKLLSFLQSLATDDKTIVFCNRKKTVDDVAANLATNKVPVRYLHGDLMQFERGSALHALKKGTVKVLVATDLASRGLDVKDITTVVNYDFPKSVEEYVHRIGRTGRAGQSGKSFTLFTKKDAIHAKDLEKILSEANQSVPEWLNKIEPIVDESGPSQRLP